MPYGTIKVDNITFTDNSVDKTVSLSGLIQNPTFTGNVTVTGTISGDVIRGGTTISGVTVTGTTANFVSGVFTTQVSGTTITGTTVATTTGSFVSLTGTTATFTSGIIASGTAALPSLAILSDPNTGIYSPGADQLAVATNGTGRLFINSAGDLGVNTGGTQGTKLHVIGGNVWSSNFYEVARFQKSSGTAVSLGFDNTAYVATIGAYSHDGTASNLSFWTYPGSGSVEERLRITSTGALNFVGAGTAGSTQAVSFNGSAPVNSLVIDSSGRLGIGTSSPGQKLDVNGEIVCSPNTAGKNTFQFTTQAADDASLVMRANTTIKVNIQANGTSYFNGGNVGIGTSSPGAPLNVRFDNAGTTTVALFENQRSVGGSPDAAQIVVGARGYNHTIIRQNSDLGTQAIGSTLDTVISNTFGSDLHIATGSPTNAARLTVTSAGLVGIGTTTVDTTLHIKGANTSGRGQLYIQSTATNVFPRFILADSADTMYLDVYGDTSNQEVIRNTGSGGKHVWQINSSEAARIDSSGRLLIGTSSARTLLSQSMGIQIETTDYPACGLSIVNNQNADANPLLLIGKSRGATLNSNTIVQSGDTLGEIHFLGADGSAMLRAASIRCLVDGTPGANDMPSRLVFSTTADGASSPTEACRIDSEQRLVVGATSAQSSRLLVKGENTASSEYVCRLLDSSDLILFFVRNDGYIQTGTGASSPYNLTTASAANVWVGANGELRRSTSSAKYKTDIIAAEHGLAELLQLRPVTYKGINDGDKAFGGLIAEEVHDAGLTEFVQYAEDGTPDALAYGNMVSLCIKAIQEQQVVISELQAKVAALESA
jgi:hypothetical protein